MTIQPKNGVVFQIMLWMKIMKALNSHIKSKAMVYIQLSSIHKKMKLYKVKKYAISGVKINIQFYIFPFLYLLLD